MKVLVLNCGSSTLKFQLIQTRGSAVERKLARGVVERIGGESSYKFEIVGEPAHEEKLVAENHEAATVKVIEWLSSHPDLGSVDAVGHRIVHGGDKFKSAVRIDEDVIKILDSLCDLAPLHNPSSVSGIHAARKVLGTAVPMVAAFDTSFHQTIPDNGGDLCAALRPIHQASSPPLRFPWAGASVLCHALWRADGKSGGSDQHRHLAPGQRLLGLRDSQWRFDRYLDGLHAARRTSDGNSLRRSGSGIGHPSSPDEGLDEVENLLNTGSGLLGVSGISSDMRELIAVYKDNPRARLAIDVFCYRARKYLGAYLAALHGADAVIFSGGIGEHLPFIRKEICGGMEWCGLLLDEGQNDSAIGTEGRISTAEARIQVFVIPSDEEAVIARQTAVLLQ